MISMIFQEHSLMSRECQKLREENAALQLKTRTSINIKEHEKQLETLSNNNRHLSEKLDIESVECKRLIRRLESDLEDANIKVTKKELLLSQVECENKVMKKMVHKYENLVDNLRSTVASVASQAAEYEKLQMEMKSNNQKHQEKQQPMYRSSSLQDVTHKEMKLISKINRKLSLLKARANPSEDQPTNSDEDVNL